MAEKTRELGNGAAERRIAHQRRLGHRLVMSPADLNAKRLELGWSFARVARASRLSPSMVGTFLKGKPTGDPELYGRLISEALEHGSVECEGLKDREAEDFRTRAFWSDRAFAEAMKGRRFA